MVVVLGAGAADRTLPRHVANEIPQFEAHQSHAPQAFSLSVNAHLAAHAVPLAAQLVAHEKKAQTHCETQQVAHFGALSQALQLAHSETQQGAHFGALPKPTKSRTVGPSRPFTLEPSPKPTHLPTAKPNRTPTLEPSPKPTNLPTARPNRTPTLEPTMRPTKPPSLLPTVAPTLHPTTKPTGSPTLPLPPPPNILLLMADDFKPLMEAYGSKFITQHHGTPNLDSLTKQGCPL
ncbi:hypothetical protein BASA81_016519 [Batrachochytrium salamandrivorans]|nr:hypothetical protein BASA81_016519 [Batrachochytrium salamandrivorans]